MKFEIGKTDVLVSEVEVKPQRQTFNPPSGGNGSNGNNDGNNGDDEQKKGHPFAEDEKFIANKSRIAMYFLLLIVIMTFSGLIGAYIVIATNKGLEWKPFSLPIQIWISSVIIIASSIVFEIYNRIYSRGEQKQAKKWLILTAVLGAIFIASQLIAWLDLVNRGIYLAGNPYAGFFYIFTGVHAFHILGGIFAVGYLILKTENETKSGDELFKRQTHAKVTTWYWHTMGGLWFILFFILGFWK